MFFTSRHSLCPNGLTIGVKGKSKEDYQLFLTIRHYGYDHSHNNGISEFSDAYDFYPERIDFTEEHLNTPSLSTSKHGSQIFMLNMWQMFLSSNLSVIVEHIYTSRR